MGKYRKLAEDIVREVGGKENINGLTHCVTRLRFKLADESKANTEKIKNLDGVITVLKSGGQYQVVVGNAVPEVYADVVEVADLGSNSTTHESKEKMKTIDVIMDFITGIFGPIIALICACGMVQGFLALFLFLGWVNEASGLYQIFYAVGQSIFYFFPVMLGYTCFAKLGGKPVLGALLGACLIYPSLQGVDLDVFGFTINASYTSTVLPIIFSSFLGVWLEKNLNKVIPDVVKSFITPVLVLAITVPIAFCVIGIVANALSTGISNCIMAVYNFNSILAGFLLGALWQVLVVFGIHQGLVGVGIASLTETGFTPIFAFASVVSFAQTGVVFAIWLKSKDKKLKDIAFPAWVSGIFGVTEPAIYGVTLPRIKYFVISCICGGIGSAIVGACGVVTEIMPGLGVFAFPSAFGQSVHDGIVVVSAAAVCLVLGFVSTYVMFKDNKTIDEIEFSNTGSSNVNAGRPASVMQASKILAPMSGKAMDLALVPDEAFAKGALGDGIAILPTSGEVKSPVDGVVTTLFPTLHAIGITADNGEEILIHIGLNTVELNGKYFTAHIKQGQKVKQGDPLVSFDLEKVKKAGYRLESPIVILNTSSFTSIVPQANGNVQLGDPILSVA